MIAAGQRKRRRGQLMEFNIVKLLLWSLCGLVWWSLVRSVFILIPGMPHLAHGLIVALGLLTGVIAYLKFIIDSSKYWSEVLRIHNLFAPMLMVGFVTGAVIGSLSAGTITWRLVNGLSMGIGGFVANLGTVFSVSSLWDRPWVLFASLVGAALIPYVIVPLLFQHS
jgi:uncharacterized membrane protein